MKIKWNNKQLTNALPLSSRYKNSRRWCEPRRGSWTRPSWIYWNRGPRAKQGENQRQISRQDSRIRKLRILFMLSISVCIMLLNAERMLHSKFMPWGTCHVITDIITSQHSSLLNEQILYITKCDSYYITKCDKRYYKLRRYYKVW